MTERTAVAVEVERSTLTTQTLSLLRQCGSSDKWQNRSLHLEQERRIGPLAGICWALEMPAYHLQRGGTLRTGADGLARQVSAQAELGKIAGGNPLPPRTRQAPDGNQILCRELQLIIAFVGVPNFI
jgi:hypothetical protein